MYLYRDAMCLMSYPQVSFEIKAIATLKTFSNRNALHGHAALSRGGGQWFASRWPAATAVQTVRLAPFLCRICRSPRFELAARTEEAGTVRRSLEEAPHTRRRNEFRIKR